MPTLALQSSRLRSLQGYWDGKRAGRRMPARRDIDPGEIPELLPYVMLIEVLRDPLDFRYRLIGTEVVAISHADYTGRRFSELQGKGPGSVVWLSCETVLESGEPASVLPPYVGPDRHVHCTENLLLPLSDDDRTVAMIFKGIDYVRARR